MIVNQQIDKRVPKIGDTDSMPVIKRKKGSTVDWQDMERDSRRRFRRNMVIFFIIIAIVSAFSIWFIDIDTPAKAAPPYNQITWDIEGEYDGVTVYNATDEPIPVLPVGWQSFNIYDEHNRCYTVIYNGETFDTIPTLGADGEQIIIPYN